MLKQPTLCPTGTVLMTKTLLILSFALLSTVGFAQQDFKNPEEDDYRELYSELKPWYFEDYGADAEVQFSDKETKPATVVANMSIVDQLYQAFAKGDIPGALANMDPNIEWNEAESFPYADGNPYIGPQAVVDGVFARIGAEWEYWNLTDIELHEMSDDKVLATLRYQAKYKKNGEVIDAQTAHFWTLKDGKIIRFQQFTDTDQVVRAVSQM
jgi:ketosteroid isomerase-like protein